MKAIQLLSALAMIGMLVTAACAAPAPVAPAAEEPAPLEEEAAAEEPAEREAPPVGIMIPSDEQVNRVIEAAKDSPTGPPSGPSHVPPPGPRVDVLISIIERLLAEDRLVNQECCDVFNRERATTYALPDQGALYQTISLAPQQPADSLLRASGEWGERGLVVGALLIYQDVDYLELGLPVGNYIVLLLREGDHLRFELHNENEAVEGGDWQLRHLFSGQVREPFSFVTSRQICFSQLELQACLKLTSPGIGEGANRELAEKAVRNLQEGGWLPPDAGVNVASALAGVEGLQTIRRCRNALEETSEGIPEQCPPSLVAAGADSLPEITAQLEPVASGRLLALASASSQASNTISETLMAIGILEVLDPLEDAVFDSNGMITTLEVGSYRIDVHHTTVDDIWLAQFIRADGAPFYVTAQPVEGEGKLVDPDTLEPIGENAGESDVLLDPVIWRPCHEHGHEEECSNPARRRRPFCINWSGAGWCDVIGY